MLYEDAKAIKVMCILLLNKMLFVYLGASKMFYSSRCYNMTVAESVFSFLPFYFSIIFLTKGKISKSVSVSQSYRAKTVLTSQIPGFQIKYFSRTK